MNDMRSLAQKKKISIDFKITNMSRANFFCFCFTPLNDEHNHLPKCDRYFYACFMIVNNAYGPNQNQYDCALHIDDVVLMRTKDAFNGVDNTKYNAKWFVLSTKSNRCHLKYP